jgi:hypothetical protein
LCGTSASCKNKEARQSAYKSTVTETEKSELVASKDVANEIKKHDQRSPRAKKRVSFQKIGNIN